MYGFKAEISGDYACFTRPELKVERVSYDVITPSAARGILEAIMWKPAIKYVIDEIAVCAPIRFENIRRNEVNEKASVNKEYIAATDSRAQRAAMVLRDVRYVITAHFIMTKHAADRDNEGKFAEMITRRIRKGQCYHQPYLGTREFPAKVRLIEDSEKLPQPIEETRSLGLMLYDLDFSPKWNIVQEIGTDGQWQPEDSEVIFTPTYFKAEMKNGVIDLRNIEVLR